MFARTVNRMIRHDRSPEWISPADGSTGLRVRRASESDLEGLLAIEQLSFQTDRISRRQYRRHLQSDSARVLVASAGHGQLVGSAVVFFRRGSDLARLYSLAVRPEARGQGLGAHLLAAAEQAAALAGAQRLGLEVRTDNQTAIALYQQHGYHQIGSYPAYYADGCDALRYRRVLLPGPESA